MRAGRPVMWSLGRLMGKAMLNCVRSGNGSVSDDTAAAVHRERSDPERTLSLCLSKVGECWLFWPLRESGDAMPMC